MKRKILYSPGYGAGWTTWNSNPQVKQYMLTYQPIIDFLEGGGKFERMYVNENLHPLLTQLKRECREKFGEDYVCCLGACDLKVVEVSGRVRLNEYDGYESLEEEGQFSDWL